MDYLINWVSSNFIVLVVVAVIASIVWRSFKRRSADTEIIKQKREQVERGATTAGFSVTQRTGAVADLDDGSNAVAGDTEYSGNTGGFAWTLVSTVRVRSHDGDDRPGRRNTDVWKRSSRCRIDSVKLPQGKFIMLMSAPGYDSASKPIKRGGLLNKVVNMAADLAIDVYVAGYFGGQYKSLVNIGNESEKIERPLLNDFLILTNHKTVAERFLDESGTALIANWRKQNQGFTRESNVDMFGLLFAPDAMVLGCQTDMANAQEVKILSDFAAALAVKMKEVLSS